MKKNSFGTILTEVLRSSGTTALLTLLVIIGAVAAALFPPLILERVINDLTAGIPASAAFALLYLALTALAGILESLQNVCITIFGQKVTHHMRSVLCSKLHRLPAAFFTEHDAGRITSRFVNDVDTVDSLFADGIISMFADACKVLSILIVIFYKSRGLGILLLLLTPLVFALTRFFQRRMLTAQLACRAAVGKVNNHVPETIRNIRMIHVFAREKYMEERYDDYISENYRATDRTNLYDSVYSPIIIMISSAVIAFMMVLAAMNSGMSAFFGIRVGTAVAMIAYVGKIFGPIESIGMEIESIQSAVAGVKRIEEFLAFPERTIPEADDTDGRSRLHMQDLSHPDCHVPAENTAEPEISFEHVTFGYEPLTPDRTSPERLVLKDFSFHVSAGETITFTGRTGAGKSTIFRLLMGLYTPVSGHVYIKGREAAGIPDAEKRALLAMSSRPSTRSRETLRHRSLLTILPSPERISAQPPALRDSTRQSCRFRRATARRWKRQLCLRGSCSFCPLPVQLPLPRKSCCSMRSRQIWTAQPKKMSVMHLSVHHRDAPYSPSLTGPRAVSADAACRSAVCPLSESFFIKDPDPAA